MPFERAPDAVALERIIDLGIARIDILGQLALLEHARGGVFEGGLHVAGAEPEAGGDPLGAALRAIGEAAVGRWLGVPPDRVPAQNTSARSARVTACATPAGPVPLRFFSPS